MASNVNPPIQKVPKSIIDSDPVLARYLEDTQFWNYQMWKAVTIDDGQGGPTNALFAKLQQQVGSGQFLRCDDNGFSCDSTEFTCDMDEA